jgi:hypothetical protein
VTEKTPGPLGIVISIDDERIKSHLDRVVAACGPDANDDPEKAAEQPRRRRNNRCALS